MNVWTVLFKKPFEYMFRDTLKIDDDAVAVKVVNAIFTIIRDLSLSLSPVIALASLIGILYFAGSDKKGERKADLLMLCVIVFSISALIFIANTCKDVFDYIFGIIG